MIGKKGVEGLPLKYLVIALVGSLTIGIALQMTGVLRQGVMTGMGVMNQSLNRKIKQSAGYKTETVQEFGVDWHFYNDDTLEMNLQNEGGSKNISVIEATYKGDTVTENNITLFEGGNTGTLDFDGDDLGSSGKDEEAGTQISISLRIKYTPIYTSNLTERDSATVAQGLLEGEVKAK